MPTDSPPPAAPAALPDRVVVGVLLMVGFCICAPMIDVGSKLAARTLPVGVITLARFVVQAALMAPLVLALRLPVLPGRGARGLLLLRALSTIAATFCFVAAMRVMPIADALAIAFVEPFIILLIGRLVLKEQVGPRRLGAAATGFAGAMVVIRPSFAAFGSDALYPLGAAFFFALYILVTRALSRRLHPVAMQAQTAAVAALVCLPLLWLGGAAGLADLAPVLPRGEAWIWCGLVGLAGTVAHLFMTYALRFAPSATLAPVHYLEMATAALFGYLVFDDFPDAITWLGIAIVVGSGLYVLHRERVTATAAAGAADFRA